MPITSRLKPLAGRIVRLILKLAERAGLPTKMLRDGGLNVVGLEIRWGNDVDVLARGAIVERTIDGTDVRFFLPDENDFLQQLNMLGRWYESEELALIASHFRGGAFVDVGANIGNHALFAGLVLGARRLYAFEPNPPAYAACKINLALNGLADRAVLRPVGLSDAHGKAGILWSGEHNLGCTRLDPGNGDLELAPGDSFFADDRVDFIKIDIEGMELKALRGLSKTIERDRPLIFVEVDDQNGEQFARFVDQIGYATRFSKRASGNVNYLIEPADRR